MKQSKNKLIVILIVVAIIQSSLFLCLNSTHSHFGTCHKEACPICSLIECVEQNINYLPIIGSVLTPIIVSFVLSLEIIDNIFSNAKTLVYLKVRLDN